MQGMTACFFPCKWPGMVTVSHCLWHHHHEHTLLFTSHQCYLLTPCFSPSPGAYTVFVWSEFAYSNGGWRNDFSHWSSQSLGIFWAACVAFTLDQFNALCSHPLRKESEAQNFELSWKVICKISGFICMMVAKMTAWAVITVTGTETLQSAWSCFLTVVTMSG